MRLMLNIAKDILEKSPKKVKFKTLFNEIKNELKVSWKEKFPRQMMDDIEKRKIGELYTHLTLDGRFIMLGNDSWTLTKKLQPSDIAKARAKLASSDDIQIAED